MQNTTITLNDQLIFKSEEPFSQFLEHAYEHSGVDYPKFYKMDPLSQAGFLCSEYLLAERRLNGYAPHEVAVVLSNSHGSLDTDLRFMKSLKQQASPALFVYTLPNIVIGEISIRHKLKGENAFFISPAFDADLLVEYVQLMLDDSSPVKACIAGWVDVLGAGHDVLLYLVEKEPGGLAMEHTVHNIEKFYS